MENASKAIILAGGILVGVIILSLLVLVFRPMGDIYTQEGESLSAEQLEKYNRQFNTFDKSLYGSEILSLKNLLEDYNNRILQGADPRYIAENEITVIVKLYNYTAESIYYEETGETVRTKFKKGDMNGEYNLVETSTSTGTKMQLNEYLNALQELEGNSELNAEQLLKEFKNIPFRCISDKTTYNSSGRIKSMYFEQVID